MEDTLRVALVPIMNRGKAIPARAWSQILALALHATHSYGYAFRSSAALAPAQQGNFAQHKSLRHHPGSLAQYAD
jgi:hypothetical protein